MLTKTQKEYLANLPAEKARKLISIKSYDPKIGLLAKNIIRNIKRTIPKVKVRFMGASAFGIAGLNDIDIYIFCSSNQKKEYMKRLSRIFSVKINEKDKWKWTEDNINISVKVTDPNERKRKEYFLIHKLFKTNKDLLKKYEDLKISMNGRSYKEYSVAKMDFLTRIVCANKSENIKNLKYLEKIGAVITNGHVIIPSGRHAKTSFTKYKLYPHIKETLYVAQTIAKQFKEDGVEAVMGIATGGDILSELVAYHLEKITKKKVLSFYIKKDRNENLVLRDNSNKELIKNKKVLLVDDTLDTGKTAKIIIPFVKNLDTQIIGMGVICTRNGIFAEDLGIPKFYTFINNEDTLSSYLPEDCPMCKKGIAINNDFGINS